MDAGDRVISIVVGIIVFLLIREVLAWYWKINERISNQRTTNELLQEQNELLKANNEILTKFVEDFMNK